MIAPLGSLEVSSVRGTMQKLTLPFFLPAPDLRFFFSLIFNQYKRYPIWGQVNKMNKIKLINPSNH